MTVTIGARGFKSFGSSATSSKDSSISALMNSTSYPNSSATIVKVSASRRWFIVTIIPKDIHAEITCVTPTSIIVATSLTVTNSVTFNILLSAAAIS